MQIHKTYHVLKTKQIIETNTETNINTKKVRGSGTQTKTHETYTNNQNEH